MKKYSILYALSFFTIPMLFEASPYVTARTWADLCAALFGLTVIYQLVYLFWLRRKEDVHFGRALARYPLYAGFSIILYIIWYYIDIYFNGYTYVFFMNTYGPYYGLEAWENAVFEHIILLPMLLFFLLYTAGYYGISKWLKKRKQKTE